jgi:hypothetical protein
MHQDPTPQDIGDARPSETTETKSASATANTEQTSKADSEAIELQPEALQILFNKDEKISKALMINPSAVETLAQREPGALIKFADASDERQFIYHSKVSEHRHKETQSQELTTRWIIGGVLSLVAMAFVYAGVTKDNTLPDRIINVVIGGAGGLGLGVYLNKKKEDD